MRKLKHAYDRGIKARRGLDFLMPSPRSPPGWLLDRILRLTRRGFIRSRLRPGLAAALERRCWRPSRTVGAAYAGFLTAGAVLVVHAARPLASPATVGAGGTAQRGRLDHARGALARARCATARRPRRGWGAAAASGRSRRLSSAAIRPAWTLPRCAAPQSSRSQRTQATRSLRRCCGPRCSARPGSPATAP